MQVFGEIVPAAAEAATAQDDGDRGDPRNEKEEEDEDDDDGRHGGKDDKDYGRSVPRRGTKRKLETEENEMEAGGSGRRLAGYSAQRQSVFNVFMCKLQRYRQVPDPSLLRSVLICNTLRSIEREMVRDGFDADNQSGSAGASQDATVVAAAVAPIETNFVPPAFQQQNDADESMDSSNSVISSSSSSVTEVGLSSHPVLHTQTPAPPTSTVTCTASAAVNTDSCQPIYTAMLPLEPVRCSAKSDVVGYEKSLGDLDCSGRATPYPSLDLDPCRRIQVEESARIVADDDDDDDDDDEDVEEEDGDRQAINWGSVLNFSSQAEDVDAADIHPTAESTWTYDDGDESEQPQDDHRHHHHHHHHEEQEGDEGEELFDDEDEEVEEEELDVDNMSDGGGGGPNTSPSASSDSGISTASDEIFGDIDLSLYDFDLVPLSPPSNASAAASAAAAAAAARQTVLPPSAEELLCSFPGERTIVLPPANSFAALPARHQHHILRTPSAIRTVGDTHHHHHHVHHHVHRGTTHTNTDST